MYGWLQFQKKLLDEYGLQARLRMLVKKCLRGMRRLLIKAADIFGLKPLLISIVVKLNQCKFFIFNPINLAPKTNRKRYIYVDISGIIRDDLRTGIQRVVRGLLESLSGSPPIGYEIKPVYGRSDTLGFCYADYQLNNCVTDTLCGAPMCPEAGDVFLGLDFQVGVVLNQRRYLDRLHRQGLKVFFVVYDLLPIKYPYWFPEPAALGHAEWLRVIAQFDGVLCISSKVASDFQEWQRTSNRKKGSKCSVNWFHLGANFDGTTPSMGVPKNSIQILSALKKTPTFLMVGTIEPRKGHEQILDAFELLWTLDTSVNLVVVGKQGWKVADLADRMRKHVELNTRFYWFENASDEWLEKIYHSGCCLVAASYDEGFGLPLIEASHVGIPIFARNIEIFKEVAGNSAYFFDASTPDQVVMHLEKWLQLYRCNLIPDSRSMKVLDWDESAQMLLASLGLSDSMCCVANNV